jgi:hypothetical protein
MNGNLRTAISSKEATQEFRAIAAAARKEPILYGYYCRAEQPKGR